MACIYFKESTRATLLDVRSALFKKLYLQVYIMFFFNFTDVIYIWGFLNLMQILFTLNSIHHLTSNISTALWLVWFVGKLSIYAAAVMFTWARETVYKALLIQGWKPPRPPPLKTFWRRHCFHMTLLADMFPIKHFSSPLPLFFSPELSRVMWQNKKNTEKRDGTL